MSPSFPKHLESVERRATPPPFPACVSPLVLSSIKYVPHDRIGHLARSPESSLDNQF